MHISTLVVINGSCALSVNLLLKLSRLQQTQGIDDGDDGGGDDDDYDDDNGDDDDYDDGLDDDALPS